MSCDIFQRISSGLLFITLSLNILIWFLAIVMSLPHAHGFFDIESEKTSGGRFVYGLVHLLLLSIVIVPFEIMYSDRYVMFKNLRNNLLGHITKPITCDILVVGILVEILSIYWYRTLLVALLCNIVNYTITFLT